MTSYATIVKREMMIDHKKNGFAKFIKFSRCWVTPQAMQPSSSLMINTLLDQGSISGDDANNLYQYKILRGKVAFFEMVTLQYGKYLK